MKKYLLLGLMFAFSVVTAHAYAPNGKAKAANQSSMSNIKFGPQLGTALSTKVGAYFEYKVHDKIGIQTGLSYFSDMYILHNPETTDSNKLKLVYVTPKYIVLPIIFRGYPGDDRQFCLFTGVQAGYLIGVQKGDLSGKDFTDASQRKEIIDATVKGKNKTELTDADQSRNLGFSIIAGFDYEFSFGLTLGLSYSKGMIDVIKAEKSYLNWTFQPTIGYNIAKLIQ
jgi:outer membrane receptor protein involved in Fe transport